MTQQEFESRLKSIKQQEEKYNVVIDIVNIIDKDHLDCTWYGGDVGYITTNDGWQIVISARGDIKISGQIKGREIDVYDKRNGGSAYNDIGYFVNDDMLRNAEKNGDVYFSLNNWFEVDLISPSGMFVDLCGADNVLDDNLLDCFENIETYFDYIEWAKEKV